MATPNYLLRDNILFYETDSEYFIYDCELSNNYVLDKYSMPKPTEISNEKIVDFLQQGRRFLFFTDKNRMYALENTFEKWTDSNKLNLQQKIKFNTKHENKITEFKKYLNKLPIYIYGDSNDDTDSSESISYDSDDDTGTPEHTSESVPVTSAEYSSKSDDDEEVTEPTEYDILKNAITKKNEIEPLSTHTGVKFITSYDKYYLIDRRGKKYLYLVLGSKLLHYKSIVNPYYLNNIIEINGIYFDIVSENENYEYLFNQEYCFAVHSDYILIHIANDKNRSIKIKDKSIAVKNIFIHKNKKNRNKIFAIDDNRIFTLNTNQTWDKIIDSKYLIEPCKYDNSYFMKNTETNMWYHFIESYVNPIKISAALTDVSSRIIYKKKDFCIISDSNLELFTVDEDICYVNCRLVDTYAIGIANDSIYMLFTYDNKVYLLMYEDVLYDDNKKYFKTNNKLYDFSRLDDFTLYELKDITILPTTHMQLFGSINGHILVIDDTLYFINLIESNTIIYFTRVLSYKKAYENRSIESQIIRHTGPRIKVSADMSIEEILFVISYTNGDKVKNVILFEYADKLSDSPKSSGIGVANSIYSSIVNKFFDEFIIVDRIPKLNYKKLKMLDNDRNYLAMMAMLLIQYICLNKIGFKNLLPFNLYYHLAEDKSLTIDYLEKVANTYDKKYFEQVQPYASDPEGLAKLEGNFESYQDYLLDIVGFDSDSKNNLICKKFAMALDYYANIYNINIGSTVYDIISTFKNKENITINALLNACSFRCSHTIRQFFMKCIKQLSRKDLRKFYFNLTGKKFIGDNKITIKTRNLENITYKISTCASQLSLNYKVNSFDRMQNMLQSILSENNFNTQ